MKKDHQQDNGRDRNTTLSSNPAAAELVKPVGELVGNGESPGKPARQPRQSYEGYQGNDKGRHACFMLKKPVQPSGRNAIAQGR